tara:strand:+ start:284 stop:679 length:396 start_codon:yes stop_codon:yes gene_type:complete
MDNNKIWYRYNNDNKQLKNDCVDVLSRCYLMLGQKPDAKQIVMMSSLLYEDLINRYSSMTIQEIQYALEKGIKDGEDLNCFINARSWNVWIKQHKASEQLKRQQKLITDYQKHQKNIKQISHTINKAKQIK